MKKTFQLENLDCANCAAEIETSIRKISGIISVSVSFFTQKITLEFDDSCQEDVLLQLTKIIKKIDSDIVLKS